MISYLSLSDNYNCPDPALCIKHCQETGYKNGICTGHGLHECQCVNWAKTKNRITNSKIS